MATTSRSRVTPAQSRVIPIKPVKLVAPLKSWSFSSLGDFERCKYYTYLKRVQKIPEPERPLPPGKSEHANDRGSRIHDTAEHYVRGTAKMAPEMRSFETEFMSLQSSFAKGMVSLEGEWGMSKDWEPADWKSAWLRLKLDALVFLTPHEAVAIDYKTGRKFGNEVKHAEQLQLYQLVTFLRYPELEDGSHRAVVPRPGRADHDDVPARPRPALPPEMGPARHDDDQRGRLPSKCEHFYLPLLHVRPAWQWGMHSGGLMPKTTHGYFGTPIYGVWNSMRGRCNNPSHQAYADYGARGIKVCARWRKFENFLADMGERPEGMTIERKRNEEGYNPKKLCMGHAESAVQ